MLHANPHLNPSVDSWIRESHLVQLRGVCLLDAAGTERKNEKQIGDFSMP